MARKHPRAYPADFRYKIVELARAGRGADDLAVEFKLAQKTRCEYADIRPSMAQSAIAMITRCARDSMQSSSANCSSSIVLSHNAKRALAVFEFIEGFYNPRRRHTSIGNISSAEFERRMSQAA